MSSRVKRLGRAVIAPVGAWYRSRVHRRGRDFTAAFTSPSALILAPHPDDDVLACGATIMRKRDYGADVHLAVATDGRRSHPSSSITSNALVAMRRREELEAARLMGVDPGNVTFFEFEDGTLPEHQSSLTERVTYLLNEIKPDQLFVPSRDDYHKDHRAAFIAGCDAVEAASFEVQLVEYPVWYWDTLPWVHRPASTAAMLWWLLVDPVRELLRPPGRLVRVDTYMERKRQAIASHGSQTGGLPGGPVLPDRFLDHFLQPNEVFFISASGGRKPPSTSKPA